MVRFWNQAVALFKKNLTYHRRHLQSNLRLVLFPAILFALLGGIRYYQIKQERQSRQFQEAKMPTEWAPLLQIPAAEFRAVKTGLMPFNDLPDQSCRIEGSCPATVLVTGNNRTFVESVAGNMFPNFFYSPNTTAYGVFGKEAKRFDGKYYYLQSQCTTNSTVLISAQGGKTEEAECLQGLLLWRKNYTEINNEVFEGHYNGNPKGETNAILAAYDFQDSSVENLDVSMWYNTTATAESSDTTVNLGSVASALSMVWNAFLQSLHGNAIRMTLEFIGEMPTPRTLDRNVEFASFSGSLFFPWVILQLFPVMLSSLVYEKEQKLTIMMKMHGLGYAPYWVITYLYFLIICSLYMLCFVVFGSLAGLTFFKLNSYAIQCVFYFVHINLLISSAFLLAKVLSNVKTASVVGFILVFGSWILGVSLLQHLIGDHKFPRLWLIVLELFPGLSLCRGLQEFYEYSNAAFKMGAFGMRWESLTDRNSGMREVLIIMSAEWLVFLLMAYCAENFLLLGSGLCFFRRSQKRPPPLDQPSLQTQESRVVVQLVDKQGIDQEMEKVENLLHEPDTRFPIVSNKLRKTYPAQDGNPEKHAVKGLTLAVAQGECFGLLGPNGAGKTSFISMLTGLTKPSSGTASIGGLDLRTDMKAIYASMGVCPQHNLLWGTLTGREHLNFYGRLKNLTGVSLSQAVEDSLRNVNLLQGGDADKLVRKYSGGMKRRLSIAISLIGDPKVIYLDEPSTGLDPASRNLLWDAVSKAKQNRAIILTTHSMEEAEHLCDRIGIFVDGSFQCLGTPDELKDRYGGTYVFTMATSPQHEKDVEDFVKHLSRNAKKTYNISGTQKFEIPKADVKLSDVFLAVKFARERFVVKAWEIADTTLEDVFVKVAKETESTT